MVQTFRSVALQGVKGENHTVSHLNICTRCLLFVVCSLLAASASCKRDLDDARAVRRANARLDEVSSGVLSKYGLKISRFIEPDPNLLEEAVRCRSMRGRV